MKKLSRLLLLALAAAFLGCLVGALSAGFLHFIDRSQKILWDVLAGGLPWEALLLCSAGGLLIGLCQRYLGDHPKLLYEAIDTIRQTRRLDYTHLPQGIVTASVSLIFGASLGPEAAIIDLLGGLSTWAGDAIQSLRRRFDLPRPSGPGSRLVNLLRSWPNLIALVCGAFAFVRLLGGLYSDGFLQLAQPFQWSDLLWSVPAGLLGVAGGVLFLFFQTWTKRWMAPLHRRPVLRGVLSGVTLGVTALALPLVLFSGQHQLQPAYDQAAELGFAVLFLTALARLLLTNLLLASGWKGGQFLPIMFASAALGLAFHALVPAFPASVAALGAMAALTAIVLPKPFIALILMALMFPIQYVGISIVAVGMVVAGKRVWERQTQLKNAGARLSPAGE
ncbi:MAG: chloride channel protein [Chloroflexi bacterium]|nr:chloride channel protein [Anaerolineaceae bacterium]NMB87271.1 chloride channel protein [Chloroflexota bacterium]